MTEPKVKIAYVPIDLVHEWEKNPRLIKDKRFKQLCKSIKSDPSYMESRALLVQLSTMKIYGGNMRWRACKHLGWEEVPVIVDDIDDTLAETRAIKDNSSFGEYDDTLSTLIDELEKKGVDLDELGLDEAIAELLEPEQEIQEDTVPEPPKEPKSKLGDLYQLGNHRLLCGDATNVDHVEKLMDGEKADMVLTDPPYGMFLDTDWSDVVGSMKSIGAKNNKGGNKYDKVIGDNDDFTPDLIQTVFANFGYCKEIFLWGGDYYADLLQGRNDGAWLVWDKRKESQANAIGSEFELCWSKAKHKRRVLRHDWFGFLSSSNTKEARNRVHPTQKPTTLIADICKQWGKENDRVVDLYGGSGTTLTACEQLNRKCYMMELDPKYIDVIIERWENLTGEKSILLTD